jgi:two-component system NtrC family sensor kinase
VGIENVRLIENLKEKMRQIELIREISSVVNSSLSIGHIFRLIVSEVKNMIDFDRASINLLDEESNSLRIFALDTKRATRLTKGVSAPVKGTSAGWVTMTQKPWINNDLSKEIAFKHDAVLLNEGIRSTISIPLYKDRPLGALNFDHTESGKYSEEDLEILLPIAKHLSIALENALLFEEISKEKREWEKTFDGITDMVWIEDIHGKVIRVNRAIMEKSGKPELFVVKKRSLEIFKILQIVNGESLSTESSEGKKRLYRELRGLDGSTFHFWTYPLLDSNGRTYGTVNYLRNVTEQKSLERQLIRADKLASLGTLVAGIAHEINNPLGIIAGYAEALIDRARVPALLNMSEFEDFSEYLETINKEIFRCKDILKSLLDFARPSTSTFREIDINELIKEVILLVKHKARKQNHTIELNLKRDIPKTTADPGALRQFFMNIIMNSLYFMEKEGRIEISTDYEKDAFNNEIIHISIADNGRGIEKDSLGKIFDPFFTTKPVGEGTGLGLSICHRIVTDHHGVLDVESTPGVGTRFKVKIPVKQRMA